MKVLMINSVCGIRSTGRICTDTADRLKKQGHECRIAYGRESVPEQYEDVSYRIGGELPVRWNGIKARLFDNEGRNAKRATKTFLRWASTYDPDLLWLHNLHGYYINYEMLFTWIKSRPHMQVRWTLHDCWAFTGHCAHFSYIGCNQWKTGCARCPQTGEYPKSIGVSACKTNYFRKKHAFCGVSNMTLITPSHWLAALVKQSFLKNYPVEVVYNRIDEEVFRPTYGNFREKYGLQNQKIVLGVASAWSERKGLSDFVKLDELLGKVYTLVLVGVDRATEKRLPSSIVCIPRTNSKKELAEIYTAADVFVNLTYEDTYPTVNLEAQACGTPCLTYKTGGSVESTLPENAAEPGDLAAIMTMIKRVCADEYEENLVFWNGIKPV